MEPVSLARRCAVQGMPCFPWQLINACTPPLAAAQCRSPTGASCMASKLGTASGSADPSTTAELGATAALQLESFWGGCQQMPSCTGEEQHRVVRVKQERCGSIIFPSAVRSTNLTARS